MTSNQPARGPSPALIFETLHAYRRTAAVDAAIELNLFTAVGEGKATVPELAARIQASEKGTRVLCDFLTVIGFLNKAGEEYRLTPESAAFLDRHSPAYVGTISRFLGLARQMHSFQDMPAMIRKGGTVMSEEGMVSPENEVWVEFARSMAPLMTMPAELVARMLGSDQRAPWKVLDIAAGHGLYGIAIAKQNPSARIVAVDWAPVLEVAEENASKAGVAGFYSTIPGSAFEVEFGTGYDVVLLTNFLHHFDAATNESLLRKVHAAMAPGARAVTVEFIPNEDRVSPAHDATFSLVMLSATPNGDAYTFAELEQMFRNAGFSRSEFRVLAPTPQRVIVSYK